MRYYQLFVLSVLGAGPLQNFAKPLAPHWDDIRVKHAWKAVPPNWETLGHPPVGTTIDLHVALKPHHENALIDALYEVSDPKSPKYGVHLSREQASQLVSPHRDTLELVNSWLGHHGVPPSSISTTHGGSWLTLTGVPVSQANEMLGASYQLYRRTGTNDSAILRTTGYALPAVLHSHVQTVVPTTYFSSPRTVRPTRGQAPRRRFVGETTDMVSRELVNLTSRSSCGRDGELTPSYLRWLYRTSTYVPAATDRNRLGVTGYEEEYASYGDLTTFMTDCRPDAVDATFTVVKINGGEYDPKKPTTEASLDMQYTQAIAYPTPHIFYSSGGEILESPGSNEPAPGDAWLEWLKYVLSQFDVPQTISTSYGAPEKILPVEYATTLCNMYAQLGTRGVSVISATGDDGVGEGECKANDGSDKVQFAPSFPASCPWVTSVGGTTSHTPEVAASLSGGGFSIHFPRPSYQDDAVPTFLQHLGTDYDGLYHPAGRGIPDISVQALNFLVVQNNEYLDYLIDGTSCAAPTAAGIISLLNDYLLSQGKSPLGFLNPWLYGEGFEGMNDITSGSNPGCGTEGFSAIVGWDPVTGLGTPDFLKLQYTLDVLNPPDEQPISTLSK